MVAIGWVGIVSIHSNIHIKGRHLTVDIKTREIFKGVNNICYNKIYYNIYCANEKTDDIKYSYMYRI